MLINGKSIKDHPDDRQLLYNSVMGIENQLDRKGVIILNFDLENYEGPHVISNIVDGEVLSMILRHGIKVVSKEVL